MNVTQHPPGVSLPEGGAHHADGHDEIGAAPPAPRPGVFKTILLALLFVVIIAALFLAGFIPRGNREAALQADAAGAARSLPRVSTAHPRPAPAARELLLPGSIEALQETAISARVTGYVKHWSVDIGDEVTATQVLAELETPELDQEIDQATAAVAQLRAKLATARANATLAESTLHRYQDAAAKGGISPQELAERAAALETARAAADAAAADITAGEANVRRLGETKAFAKLRAPFAGTVTRRNAELGALVTAGTTMPRDLFRIAEVDVVRLFVDVPQSYAPWITIGTAAEILVREFPGRTFAGKVARTTHALDPSSRTLRTEIDIPNPDRKLMPGTFARAKLTVTRDRNSLLIPASALLVSADGTQVAMVTADDQIHFQHVEVEIDNGTEVSISAGLTPADRVVTNPGERLKEGGAVEVAPAAATRSESR